MDSHLLTISFLRPTSSVMFRGPMPSPVCLLPPFLVYRLQVPPPPTTLLVTSHCWWLSFWTSFWKLIKSIKEFSQKKTHHSPIRYILLPLSECDTMPLVYPGFPLESRTQDRLLYLEVVLGNKKWDLKSTAIQGHSTEQPTIVVSMLDLAGIFWEAVQACFRIVSKNRREKPLATPDTSGHVIGICMCDSHLGSQCKRTSRTCAMTEGGTAGHLSARLAARTAAGIGGRLKAWKVVPPHC